MSIEEMLKGVKVEWKKLGDISKIDSAGVDKKINNNEKVIKLLNYMDVYRNLYIDNNTANMNVTAPDIKISRCDIRYADVFITPSSETIEDIFHSTVAKENLINTVYSYHIVRIRLNNLNFITSCYINYLFKNENFRKQIYKKVNGNTRKTISKIEIENLQIPLPPLEVQEKIVKRLDFFTKYVTELQAELQNRKKQYNFYRDKLLSEDYLNKIMRSLNTDCENFVLELKKIGDICLIQDSKRKPISKENRINGIYPYYGANGIQDYINDYIFDGSFILMGEDGSVINKDNTPILHYINNKKIWVNNHAHVLGKLNENYNLKYIYYYLSQYDVSKIVKGTPPKITQENMKNIEIYIPDIQIQNRIVKVLDKFQELIENAEGLLPEEIEKRQKQYEYYREKLLTFTEECGSSEVQKNF